MSTVQKVKELLATLTQAERDDLLRGAFRDSGHFHYGIVSTPGVSGGDACIVRTRIPVWLLESLRRQGVSDAELLQAYPQLHAQDLVNAWAYADAHRVEIDRQIAEQEAA